MAPRRDLKNNRRPLPATRSEFFACPLSFRIPKIETLAVYLYFPSAEGPENEDLDGPGIEVEVGLKAK